MKTSKNQLKANYNWKKKHPDKQRAYQYASYAKKFVRDIASKKQLLELRDLINQRLN